MNPTNSINPTYRNQPVSGALFVIGASFGVALVGTLVPGASRLNIDSKNALTGGIGSGSAGGWFAAELKYAGYDNIVIA